MTGQALRERLPDRRQNETVALRCNGQEFTVTIGFDGDGRPKEVFANAARTGTELSHLLADACVIISLALQFGVAPEGLSQSLGRVPDLDRGKGASKPASVLGAIVAVLIEVRSDWPGALERMKGGET